MQARFTPKEVGELLGFTQKHMRHILEGARPHVTINGTRCPLELLRINKRMYVPARCVEKILILINDNGTK